MGSIVQILRNLGVVRLSIMAVVAIGMIGFFVFMTTRLTGSTMKLLYADLEPADAGRIVDQLDQQNIPYEIEANGTRILVPETDVGKIRLNLASQGLPGGGSVGYEIFNDTSAIGTTNFMQNVNLVRALEGELARTIQSLNSVNRARVHLVLPQRQLFSRERQEASASVVLKVRTPGRLPAEQVASIQHVVAAAVPGLDPQHISVIDDKGNLLARGDEGENGQPLAQDLDQRRIAFENRMARTVEELLEKSVGMGNVRAQVSADMDFSRLSTTEETYDPEGQVVRSTQTVDEQSQSTEAEGNPPVTVATNLPDQGGGTEGARSNNQETRSEETVNYEISKKVINHIREFGEVRRLSVAVLINGRMVENAQGEMEYQPRPQAEMDNLAKLASSSIGFNAERGDTVEVINMRFAPVETEFEAPLDLFFGLQKNDLLRIAEVIVLSILAILVILLVVRPLVSRAFEAIPAAAAAAEQRLLAEQAAAAPAISGPERPPAEEEGYEELIDIDRVEGRVRASSVKKVGEIVDKHPEEALSILRAWMYQEA